MLKHQLIVILFLSSLTALQVQAANMYKYQDSEGKEFVGSQVPAEYVKNGYEILNQRGQVIEVIPRALTDVERAAIAESEQEQRIAETVKLKQEEEDTLLLRLYRSPEEVVRRRDSTIQELDGQLTVLNALLTDAEEEVASVQKIIDDNIAAGRVAPPNQVARLKSVTEEKDRLSRQVARIEAEKEETNTTAQKNIDRLKTLLKLE